MSTPALKRTPLSSSSANSRNTSSTKKVAILKPIYESTRKDDTHTLTQKLQVYKEAQPILNASNGYTELKQDLDDTIQLIEHVLSNNPSTASSPANDLIDLQKTNEKNIESIMNLECQVLDMQYELKDNQQTIAHLQDALSQTLSENKMLYFLNSQRN